MLMMYWTSISLIPIFIVFAKFGISAAFNMTFIASVQLIPTIIAASVFGYCNMVARTITILSPLVAEIVYPVPLVINICAAFLALVASQFIV